MSPLGLSKASLLLAGGEAPYEGASVSADLLWHLKKYETAGYGSANAENVTFNVGGTNRNSRITTYSGNQGWGSGSISAAASRLACVRVEGNLTINSGFTLTTSTTCNGLYIFVDGDLTVAGTISLYDKGQYISGGAGSMPVNSSANEVAGSTTITMSGSAGSHTNGSSTASSLQTGGGGRGGYGSYGRGSGSAGHIFSGGSGGGGGGGVAYYNFYQGGGSAGYTSTAYAGKGGKGGNSGYTLYGYATADAGGSGGTGNPGGDGGTNNSRNSSDSRTGYTGDTGTPGSLVLYATGNITINSGATLSTAGRVGRSGSHFRMPAGGGGGSAGAILVAVCAGTFTNNGTITTSGGAAGAGRGSGTTAGSGGKLTGGGY